MLPKPSSSGNGRQDILSWLTSLRTEVSEPVSLSKNLKTGKTHPKGLLQGPSLDESS